VGLGSTQIIVPDGIPVDVNASANAGDLRIFEREANGVGVDLDYVDPDRTAPALTINFDGGLGELRVTRP
ncbi:MAG: hypothetical protein JWP10_1466, partial [Nocardioidaceae bacterium]|nr:hypothetical protein [Nocardioidaceae bacterium]